MTISRKIKNFLIPDTNEEINDFFDMSNMSAVRTICIFAAIIESLSMLNYLIQYYNNLIFNMTSLVTMLVIIASSVLAYLSTLFLKGKISGHHTALIISFICTLVISLFGLYVSYMNYKLKRQIIIFFVVNLCIVCFIQIVPLFNMLYLVLEHAIFYYLLYSYDGARGIITLNAITYLLVLLIINGACYHRMYKFVISINEAKILAEDIYMHSAQDTLTGLLNRYKIDSILVKKGVIYQVAIIEIDQFKSFNNKYGHLKGDEVLKLTASGLLDVFRKKDCYRYGSDEFLVLTTIHNEDDFRDRLAIWENKLSEVLIKGVEDSIHVSYGVSSGVVRNKEDVFVLIKEAEDNLNNIKSVRNRLN
ncbi:MAG: GGDEF domain-containing protein [Butyrivibrio sp.]|uniref:GGDEF domain-containing protein n=1 Tax=Butyrivibrio sp. TaxID=28121 RepID=UPI0025FEEB2A|nr:GGDEF domain-containing protein [Butyrivibrio sp.]MCR5771250.1 GGDEF domain-containing protein [Butyrivibrio sp.]